MTQLLERCILIDKNDFLISFKATLKLFNGTFPANKRYETFLTNIMTQFTKFIKRLLITVFGAIKPLHIDLFYLIRWSFISSQHTHMLI